MKQAYIKDKTEFNKVAEKYGFTKRNIGNICEKWFKQTGRMEIEIYNGSNKIMFTNKGWNRNMGKSEATKFIKDILHLIEWR